MPEVANSQDLLLKRLTTVSSLKRAKGHPIVFFLGAVSIALTITNNITVRVFSYLNIEPTLISSLLAVMDTTESRYSLI